jgi:hypothetical protein
MLLGKEFFAAVTVSFFKFVSLRPSTCLETQYCNINTMFCLFIIVKLLSYLTRECVSEQGTFRNYEMKMGMGR